MRKKQHTPQSPLAYAQAAASEGTFPRTAPQIDRELRCGVTEIQEIIKKLKKMGAREITDEEKGEPWYQEHLKQLERWRKEEVGKPFTVRERQALYRTQQSSKSKAH